MRSASVPRSNYKHLGLGLFIWGVPCERQTIIWKFLSFQFLVEFMTKCHASPCSGSSFCLTFCILSSQPRDGQLEPVEWECWLIHKCGFNKGLHTTSKYRALAQNLLEFFSSSSLGHVRSLSCLPYCKAKWNVKQFQPKWPVYNHRKLEFESRNTLPLNHHSFETAVSQSGNCEQWIFAFFFHV